MDVFAIFLALYANSQHKALFWMKNFFRRYIKYVLKTFPSGSNFEINKESLYKKRKFHFLWAFILRKRKPDIFWKLSTNLDKILIFYYLNWTKIFSLKNKVSLFWSLEFPVKFECFRIRVQKFYVCCQLLTIDKKLSYIFESPLLSDGSYWSTTPPTFYCRHFLGSHSGYISGCVLFTCLLDIWYHGTFRIVRAQHSLWSCIRKTFRTFCEQVCSIQLLSKINFQKLIQNLFKINSNTVNRNSIFSWNEAK